VRRTLAFLTTLVTAATGLLLTSGVASADPSAADWEALRQCESTGRYDINTGNGYYGAYQFDLSTWRSVGGSGRPDQATPAEQDYRALYLYRMRGWQPWTCARIAGLSEDGDARSKNVPTYGGGSNTPAPPPPPPSAPSAPAPATPSGVPAYPGRIFTEGVTSDALVAWQKQMGARGFGLTGTGFYGALTKSAVISLQQQAGLEVDGKIGRNTWNAAWTTSFGPTSAPAAPAAPSTPAAPAVPANAENCSVGASAAPAWPGVQYNPGDTAAQLQCWQKQMGSRGYGLVGTGYYGPSTKAVVIGVQQRNGLNPSGILGPKTWAAAWEGS